MEQSNGHDHEHGHGKEGRCCGGKGHKDGQGHCGQHGEGHGGHQAPTANATPVAPHGQPGDGHRCCRGD